MTWPREVQGLPPIPHLGTVLRWDFSDPAPRPVCLMQEAQARGIGTPAEMETLTNLRTESALCTPITDDEIRAFLESFPWFGEPLEPWLAIWSADQTMQLGYLSAREVARLEGCTLDVLRGQSPYAEVACRWGSARAAHQEAVL